MGKGLRGSRQVKIRLVFRRRKDLEVTYHESHKLINVMKAPQKSYKVSDKKLMPQTKSNQSSHGVVTQQSKKEQCPATSRRQAWCHLPGSEQNKVSPAVADQLSREGNISPP